jgi:hypothetical protein
VNVDGSYLDNSLGSVVNDLEVRKGDSLRVFVELTASENGQLEPQKVEDDLVFGLESGVEQRVHLQSWSWDAVSFDSLIVSRDTTIESQRPVVVYGGIRVDSAVTLTISQTKVFFHDGAGIDVYGRLVTNGTPEQRVVLRGDRLDHMFDYLPYDNVSGQWRGVRFFGSSTGNLLNQTEIRNAKDAVVCDSAAFDANTFRLIMDCCIVHNCDGAGVETHNANVALYNCQLTNTLGDCLAVYGGRAEVVYCTLAQFYPFSANRGAALRFTNYWENNKRPLEALLCINTLVTGYSDDVVMGEANDSLTAFNYRFDHCLLRTPEVGDTVKFVSIIWEPLKGKDTEKADSTVEGKRHFAMIDEEKLRYDFHLDSLSTACGAATLKYNDLFPIDLDGLPRRQNISSMGCYERQ